jgi:prepilin signal peptidase PulO-like enzyme (type II secretory pathway)
MAENEQMPETDTQATIFDEDEFLNRGYDKHIRQARNTIFVVAAIQFIFALVSMFATEDVTAKWLTFGIATFIALIFVALALWTKKKPYTAILLALIIYCLLILIYAVSEPLSILKGIILRVIIIMYLARGLKNAKEAQEMQKALGK